jgi:hypothetical protein
MTDGTGSRGPDGIVLVGVAAATLVVPGVVYALPAPGAGRTSLVLAATIGLWAVSALGLGVIGLYAAATADPPARGGDERDG